MDISPLRFLDYDTSQKLSKDIRNSKEKKARNFHSNLFKKNLDIDRSNHNLISSIFKKVSNIYILQLYSHKYPPGYPGHKYTTVNKICWQYEIKLDRN